ncbi:MAG: hypothetical protein IIA03_01070 [Proteobacteria bacterium]|jgi:hypothetical protein|nr:hypothetical protein [Methylibium sp.]MCH8854856.1 hypothetical protein [Pseudomonadota bacterium]|mmetsp:Transcript_1422/g.4253  ORF Transcript_1422/g.4253 Transcript_1422/m.4253 type:complete len:175 (-) Transcript_1422:109-633(-)
MRRPERLAALALLLAALHGPAAARPMPCTLVFGQARNLPEAGGPDWQALNEDFAAAVAAALDGSGRRIVTMSLPNDRIDARATGLALLQRADESGCNTLIEATVFADVEQILVLRLRVYPLLPQLGGDGGIVGLRIGAPLFVSQRELALATLPRLRPELLAAQMAGEYLQHDRR